MEGAAAMLELQSRAWRKRQARPLQSFITQLPPLFKHLFQIRNEERVKITVKIFNIQTFVGNATFTGEKTHGPAVTTLQQLASGSLCRLHIYVILREFQYIIYVVWKFSKIYSDKPPRMNSFSFSQDSSLRYISPN